MRIDKIFISEFGALKNRSFSLKDGINVFEGQNESGKSTVVSFIRFMLYGMPKKTASQELSDRERWLSWDGLTSSGSMEITVPDGSFRIERKYQLKGNTAKDAVDECKIIDLSTGEVVYKDEVPGKVFLGITPDVYDSTACVRQLECSNIDGSSVRSSIENLILSADEKIDTQKAQALLDKHRKVLLHKNAKGGLIYDSEIKKADLFAALTKAKDDAEVIISKQNAIAHLTELEAGHLKCAEESAEKIRVYEVCSVLKRFGELHGEEEQIYSLQNSLKELTETRGYNNTLPDRHLLDALDVKERELNSAADKHGIAVGELANAEAAPCGDRILAAIHTKVREAGGKEKVVSRAAQLLKKRSSAISSSVFLYIFGAIFMLAGAFGLVAPILPVDLGAILDLIPLADAVKTYAFAGVTALGAILITLAILRSASASKRTKERFAHFAEFGLNSKTALPEELGTHIDRCEESFNLCVKHDKAYELASAKETEAASALKNEIERAVELLCSIDTIPEDTDPRAIAELLKARRTDLSEVCAIKEDLEIKLKTRQNTALSIKSSLSDHNEQELRGSIPADTDVILIATTTDIADLKRRHDFSRGQHASTMERRVTFEKELAALNATAADPGKLDTEYRETCRILDEGRRNYDAIMMAMEAINTASDTIRKNVTPTIRTQASSLIGKLTSGKYSEIGLGADLEINVNVGGETKSIDAMSKGTRDAAYISLRMALVALICSENPPPLIFDEGFSLLDDGRTKNMLTMLYAYTQHDGQCLLFTCHKRETEILRLIGNFNHVIL